MIAAIMTALVAIATRGECLEADHYPTDATELAMVTGYAVIDGCALPTTAELPREALEQMAKTLATGGLER